MTMKGTTMRRLALILVCVAGVVFLSSCRKGGAEGDGGAKKVKIAVIPKGTTHIFWQSVHAGAQKAADEFGVEIEWIGPERESDREKQIQIVDDCIVKKMDGVVLAPNDAKALVPSVEKVTGKGIPCVIIDSGVDTDKYVTFAATDNYKGGVIAAQRMGKILNGKGKVLVLKYAPGSASTEEREKGFFDTIAKEFPDIAIVDSKHGMDTVETSLQAAEDLLTKHTEIDGFYACNETTAVGTLQALTSAGRTGVKFVGFDAGDTLVGGLTQGKIDSLVVQDPFKMGYEGVKAVVDALNGRAVPKRIDTGVELVTRERLEEPAIRKLLNLQ